MEESRNRLTPRDAGASAQAFDAAWSAIRHSELTEIKTVRRKLSLHDMRTFLQLVLAPLPTPEILRRYQEALVMYDDKARDIQDHWGDPGGYTHNALLSAQLVHGDLVAAARAAIAEEEGQS